MAVRILPPVLRTPRTLKATDVSVHQDSPGKCVKVSVKKIQNTFEEKQQHFIESEVKLRAQFKEAEFSLRCACFCAF